MMNKKANILTENLIFIILNLVFFASMVGFIYLQSSSIHLTEESTAKKIALDIALDYDTPFAPDYSCIRCTQVADGTGSICGP